MKMPRRPFYPVTLPPDIFGLHHLTIIELACESDEDTKKRVVAVEKGVISMFKAACRHLGEEEARRLFARAVRRPKRGKGRCLAGDRDLRLLKEYDTSAPTGETVAALARRLHTQDKKLGASAGAIQAQIRKLVAERAERQRSAAIQARRWRMATRGETSIMIAAREK